MDRAGKARSRGQKFLLQRAASLSWSSGAACAIVGFLALDVACALLKLSLSVSPVSLSLSLCLLRCRVVILPGLGISLFWSLQNKNLWLLFLLVCKSSGVVEDLVS
jgi:hypothetical protein